MKPVKFLKLLYNYHLHNEITVVKVYDLIDNSLIIEIKYSKNSINCINHNPDLDIENLADIIKRCITSAKSLSTDNNVSNQNLIVGFSI